MEEVGVPSLLEDLACRVITVLVVVMDALKSFCLDVTISCPPALVEGSCGRCVSNEVGRDVETEEEEMESFMLPELSLPLLGPPIRIYSAAGCPCFSDALLLGLLLGSTVLSPSLHYCGCRSGLGIPALAAVSK